VRISLTGPDGHELILNVIEAGQLFGEIAMLDGRDRTADATFVEPTELLIIDRRDFLPFLARHSEVAVRLLLTLCERMRTTTDQIEDIFLLPITARLAKKLLQMATAHGETTPAGVRIGARLSQRELGGMLGVSRESINKHLAAWQKAGLVRVENGAITVCDRAAVGRLADGGAEMFEPGDLGDKPARSPRRAV
jgi:CRP-like cAMP-binding protein